MRISKLVLENINVIASAEIDFDKCKPVTMIVGVSHGAGASSNGAGKSTILQAIPWVLFGKEIRKRAKGRIIREGASACSGEITLVEGEEKIVIERTRTKSGATTVRINGEKIETATGGQEIIERRIGITYDLFCRTVLFAGELSSFCRLSAPERSKMLEEMIGVTFYAELANKIRENTRALEEECAEASGRIAARQQAIQQQRDGFHHALNDLARESLKSRALANKHLLVASRTYDTILILEEEVSVLATAAAASAGEYTRNLTKWRSSCAEMDVLTRDAAVESCKAEAVWDVARNNATALRTEVARLDKSNIARSCPTCGQSIKSGAAAIDTSKFWDRIRAAEAVRDGKKTEYEAFREVAAAATKSLQALRAKEPKEPRVSTDLAARTSDLQTAWQEFYDAGASARIVAETYSPDVFYATANRCVRTLFHMRGEDAEDAAKFAANKHKLAGLTYWRKGFSREGIPSLLLDSVAPTLNEAVRPYVEALTEGAYDVSFDNAQDGGNFNINVRNIEGGSAYEDLSRGELARVDLCVLFAIRDLMARNARTKFTQCFLDEVLDGVDAQGTEMVTRLLRSGKIASQTVFISHDPALQEAADTIILVEKTNCVSTVTLE